MSYIYYKSELTQNSKIKERNSFVLYFLGVFCFTLYFELPPYLIKGAMCPGQNKRRAPLSSMQV
jgi:hypothetical protein